MDRPAPSLFTVLPTGLGLQALTHPPFPHADFSPAYSPDGQQVIFESDRRYGDFCCHDLFVVPASGGTPKRVHLPFDAYEARLGNRTDAARHELGPVRDAALHGRRAAVHHVRVPMAVDRCG